MGFSQHSQWIGGVLMDNTNVLVKKVVHCTYDFKTRKTIKKELKGKDFEDWIEENKSNQTILKEVGDDNTNI